MIWSAALPAAASRVLRVAAGRRALHVALLVGGLFVLGLLCGGRAQAADEAPEPLRDTVGRVLGVTDRAQSPLDAVPARETGSGSGQGSGPVLPGLRPVSEHIVRTVQDRVVRPVGDVVATVTGRLEAVAGTGTGTEVPPLQVLPDPLVIGDLTGHSQPAESEPQPDTASHSVSATDAATDPATETASAPAATDASGAADPSGAAGARDAEGAGSPAPAAGYGPRSGPVTPTAPTARAGGHRAARERTGPTGDAPVRPAPGGDPDGTLGSASGADHGTPRHGDACAVTPQCRIAFRLVPGTPERADAAGLRESYRDIPVSPA
ncbi:hypothetical protein [Streptomyces sp. NPDC048187]|uniref:hypothetical protein n=1 Tax=Streptomyces sp. NPDC048187 TaxID=3365509 RepID=UPI00370F87C7